MAVDPKKRQKALAKKAAKRKAKTAAIRAAISAGLVPRLSAFPIHECLVPADLFERGIGNVLVTRRLPHGDIATGGFLVDPWCLGIKNALLRIDSESRYEDLVEHLLVEEHLEEVDPAYAKKLILEAVAYARDVGFAPHPDYRQAARALEGIDEGACREVFTFGNEGKPFFISGPNDTPARCRLIVRTLSERFGPDGFHFMVHGTSRSDFREMGFRGPALEGSGPLMLPGEPAGQGAAGGEEDR
jgi:hypothetical protein